MDSAMGIGFSWTQDSTREMGLVWGIWKVLCFQAKAILFMVNASSLTG